MLLTVSPRNLLTAVIVEGRFHLPTTVAYIAFKTAIMAVSNFGTEVILKRDVLETKSLTNRA